MRASGHRVLFAFAFTLAALLAWPLPAGAEQVAPVAVQGLDVSAYPSVVLRATVPSNLLQGDGSVEFEVTENGSKVKDLKVEHLTGDFAPPDVVLVIDTSGSMEGQPIADARSSARTFVESLGDAARVGLVTFDDEVRVEADLNAGRSEVLGRIDGLAARGETALYDAVLRATSLMSGTSQGQRAIVVISDGGDTVSASSFETVIERIAATGVPVFALALKSGEYNPQALATITQASSGRLISVKDTAQLGTSFEAIAVEIRDAYQLTYTSAGADTKDIEVDIRASNGGNEAAAPVVYPNPRFDWAPPGAEEIFEVARADGSILVGAAALAAASAALLVFGLLALLTRERTRLADLRFYDQLRTQADTRGGVTDQVRDRVVEAVGAIAGRRGFTQVIGLKLEQAGLPLRPAEFMTVHIVSVVFLGVAAQLLVGNLVLSVGLVLVGAFAPIISLDLATERRRERFEMQLPDILSMMASSLRGGWGLLQAIEFVVAQAGPPAAPEFRRVQTEARLGMPLEECLQGMARRIGSADFDVAVTAIIIQREVGGNLAEVLDIVAKTVRDRAALSRQVRSLTAEGRLSAWILTALPFVEAFLLLLVSPGYLTPLVTTLPGIGMLVGALVLMVIGGLWLRTIMAIEV